MANKNHFINQFTFTVYTEYTPTYIYKLKKVVLYIISYLIYNSNST